MQRLNTTILALVATLILLTAPAHAVEKMPYSPEAFAKAQEAGVPVLIDVYADWCPTCERQQIILNRYMRENPDSPLKIMVIDYDKNKDWVKAFRAPRQSTLYLYKDNEQRWFAVAPTSSRVIYAAIEKVIGETPSDNS
ncbi:Uncharacterised protein [BD1-7 clade bacterium]|uniref:Thioredoxin domain-containing protein n=1 Tax=BD1-7 clade bacterium TaxID=2029982 RepID=A0A5S9P1B2_9GAMM|nr:Uncharacterised protein [BD1-7 clade bacterium]CAA0122530.1 Uncharacterised protein [BD1-7 clade bacterium]